MTEGYGTVVREILSDQNVTIETTHFMNCKYTDTAEGLGGNRKDFAFCKVSSKLCICRGLQSEEGDCFRKNI